jgi:hypothetical protein
LAHINSGEKFMTRVFLGVAALVASLSGCASQAKLVSRDIQTGTGVVSIPENTDSWPFYYRRSAMEMIAKDVGPNPERYIINEERVKVGQQVNTSNNQQMNSNQAGNRQSITGNATSTTSDVYEYRITYQKRPLPPGTPASTLGVGSAQQTQYLQGAGTPGGLQPAGGIVPNVGPGGGGFQPGAVQNGFCTDPNCRGH